MGFLLDIPSITGILYEPGSMSSSPLRRSLPLYAKLYMGSVFLRIQSSPSEGFAPGTSDCVILNEAMTLFIYGAWE